MPPSSTIRPYQSGDEVRMAQLCNAFAIADPNWVPAGTVFTEEMVTPRAEKWGCFVYEQNGVVDGFVSGYVADGEFCDILFIVIDPSMSGRKRLEPVYSMLVALASFASDRGCTHIGGTIPKDSETATSFAKYWLYNQRGASFEESVVDGKAYYWLRQTIADVLTTAESAKGGS